MNEKETCGRCSQRYDLHMGHLCAVRDTPPTPKAKPMKSKLEILRDLIEERKRHAEEIERLQIEINGGESKASRDISVASVAYELVLRDIGVAAKATVADDDHGAALALALGIAHSERDRLITIGGEMSSRMAVMAAERDKIEEDADGRFRSQAATIDHVRAERDRYDSECNRLKAALASVEGERDKLLIELREAYAEPDQLRSDLADANRKIHKVHVLMNKGRIVKDSELLYTLTAEIKEALA